MSPDGRLLVVADAVGLRARASDAAGRAISVFTGAIPNPPTASRDAERALHRAFDTAHDEVRGEAESHSLAAVPDGVSLATLLFVSDRVVVGHAGNSRCYRFRQGSVSPLTRDHSAVAELYGDPLGVAAPAFDPFQIHHRNALTRGLGIGATVRPELSERDVRAGDRFVLCTASLWAELSEGAWRSALEEAATAERACHLLEGHVRLSGSGYAVVVADVHAPGR